MVVAAAMGSMSSTAQLPELIEIRLPPEMTIFLLVRSTPWWRRKESNYSNFLEIEEHCVGVNVETFACLEMVAPVMVFANNASTHAKPCQCLTALVYEVLGML